jgi:hypothetical protein
MMSSDDNEPASLTEEMGSEVTEEEPIDDLVNPLDTVSPQDVQTEYEETRPIVEQEDSTFIETAKVERMKPTPERIRKAKRKRSSATESESKSLSKLHSELRKHSDARKKTDLAVKDIEKQLKALLLAHHSAIKDLKKQVTQVRTKLATIESKKSIAKKGARKTTSKKSKRDY